MFVNTEDRNINAKYYIFVLKLRFRARMLCAGHALLVSSYGSSVRELTMLCHRSSRACPTCSVALKECSACVLVALAQQYAVRELTLCHRSSRSHDCTCGAGTTVWYLYVLACSSCVLDKIVVLVQQYCIYTYSLLLCRP